METILALPDYLGVVVLGFVYCLIPLLPPIVRIIVTMPQIWYYQWKNRQREKAGIYGPQRTAYDECQQILNSMKELGEKARKSSEENIAWMKSRGIDVSELENIR